MRKGSGDIEERERDRTGPQQERGSTSSDGGNVSRQWEDRGRGNRSHYHNRDNRRDNQDDDYREGYGRGRGNRGRRRDGDRGDSYGRGGRGRRGRGSYGNTNSVFLFCH